MQNSRTRETDEEEKRRLRGREEEQRAADRHLRSRRFVNPFCPPRWLVASRTLATFAFLGARYTPLLTKRRDRVSRNTSAFREGEIIWTVKV